jgi:hypothetical protein
MQEWGKQYPNEREMQSRYFYLPLILLIECRFENFQVQLRLIERRNAAAKGVAIHNVTKFSDMSVAEFRSYPCGVDK